MRRAAWRWVWAWAVVAALAAPGAGQAAVGESAALRAFLKLSNAKVGYQAVRLRDGAVLAARQAETPMLPASVQKLLTSAVALETLGADFQFVTTLAVLADEQGAAPVLLLVGDGDPTLGDPVLAGERGGSIYDTFDAWAERLAAAGQTRFSQLVLDAGIFDAGRHPDWPANQANRWYCAPVGGLNFNNNCLDVTIRVADGRASADLSPRSRYIDVTDQVRLGRRDVWNLSLSNRDAAVRLTGEISQSMTEPLSVAVNEPALLAGRVLADRLARAGIVIDQMVLRPAVTAERRLPAGAAVAGRHVTPIATVLARANKPSLNMMAECLLLRSAVQGGEAGTFAAAERFGSAVLTSRVGLDGEQFRLADGSGMSRNNRLSAAAACWVLARLADGPGGKTFLQSLAVGGVDGTLKSRLSFGEKPRVLGKTGTLAGASALAGYVLDAQGRPAVAFAMICTGPDSNLARQAQDALVEDLVRLVDAAAAN